MANIDEQPPLELEVDPLSPSKSQSASSPPHPITVMPSSSVDMDTSPSIQSEQKQSQKDADISSYPHADPMEISISAEDAKNIREASRAFNEALKLEVEKESKKKARSFEFEKRKNATDNEGKDSESVQKGALEVSPTSESSPNRLEKENEIQKTASATVKHETETSESKTQSTQLHTSARDHQMPSEAKSNETFEEKRDLTTDHDEHDSKSLHHHLFIKAAQHCGNPLVESFLKLMQKSFGKDSKEVHICLLLFMNMDKSSKLISAFDIAATDMGSDAVDDGNIKVEDFTESNDRSSRKRKHDSDIPDDAPSAKIEKKASKDDVRKEDLSTFKSDTKENESGNGIYTSENESKAETSDDGETRNSKEVLDSSKQEMYLHYKELVSLFKCFLTSISSCIHENSHNDDTSTSIELVGKNGILSNTPKSMIPSTRSSAVSPECDSPALKSISCSLSNQKEKEIQYRAEYATKQLIKFALDAKKDHSKKTPDKNMDTESSEDIHSVAVSFETFGDWYNSGGFDLMPWIELLDLAKWESVEVDSKMDSRTSDDSTKAGTQSRDKSEGKSVEDVSKSPPVDLKPKTHSSKPNSKKVDEHHSVDIGSKRTNQIEETEHKESPLCSSSQSQTQSNAKSSDEHPSRFASSTRVEASSHASRSIVSFDFTSSMPSYYNNSDQPFCIDITAENLQTLKNLVMRTGLYSKSPSEVCDILLRHQYNDMLDKTSFVSCVRELFPAAMNSGQFQQSELVGFSNLFNTFFACFDRDGKNVVNARELAVGFSFLCSGNKSKKLAVSFDLLDVHNKGYLSAKSLSQYLRSYLTMLVGISYLTINSSPHFGEGQAFQDKKRADMIVAVNCGAQRTQGHVLKSINTRNNRMNYRTRDDEQNVTFEEFAEWYTVGGYTVAPWLELLDLNKFLSLLESSSETDNYDTLATTSIGEPTASSQHIPRLPSTALSPYDSSSLPQHSQPTQHHSSRNTRRNERTNDFDGNMFDTSANYQNETLFTFPLAHKDSLVVTREDARYVNSVVDQLKLLSFEPEDVWASLNNSVLSNPESRGRNNKQSLMIDQSTFIYAMKDLINRVSKKRIDDEIILTLKSFHQSFDLRREGFVTLNQLMGGLTLLCGGRKSAKLSFAFGLFRSNPDSYYRSNRGIDGNKNEVSLDRRDLYTFFRSFLIVLFSCCGQSLDLDANELERHISDTAQMVCNDIIKHQWRVRGTERVNFDDFGEWYNEGGFEIAPWLELLDLNKWVLLDSLNPISAPRQGVSKYNEKENKSSNYQDHPQNSYSRYELNSNVSSRKNDYYNQHENSRITSPRGLSRSQIQPHKRESGSYYTDTYHMDDGSVPTNRSTSYSFSDNQQVKKSSYRRKSEYSPNEQEDLNALKFNLLTTNDHKGFIVSIGQQRVSQIRNLVVESGLCRMDTATVCNRILENAAGSSDKKNDNGIRIFRKDNLDNMIRSMIDYCSKEKEMSPDLQRNMSDTFMLILHSFLRDRRVAVDANEFACGFSILCGGRKSDKLEYAFDLLDEDKDGKLSRRGMFRYLRSFLTVVMGLSVSSFGRTFGPGEQLKTMDGEYDRNSSIADAIDDGAAWATDQVFRIDDPRSSRGESWRSNVSFDDFAEWYTMGGYSSIPWLELLDLKKWVLVQT